MILESCSKLIILSQHFIKWRRKHLNLCLYCCFCPTFALNLSERNCLSIGNSVYSRLIWNDTQCKSIVIFRLIEKSVLHMPLKALVIITHTVSMAWRVSTSFSMCQNGIQSTIDRRCFLPSLCQEHETFFGLLIFCTLLNGMQVWTKGSVAVGSTYILMPVWFNVDLSCWCQCAPPNNPSSIRISRMNPPKPPLFLTSNTL